MTGKRLIRKKMCVFIIVVASFFITMGSVVAKTPQFRLDMDSLYMEMGVSGNLTFSLINAEGAEIIDVKGLDHFDIISKSNSSSTQIINGDVTYQVNVNYVIMPKEIGEFTLQGNVQYNGTTYETNVLKVNVGQPKNDIQGEVKDLFVKTQLTNDTIYFGQKVVLGYELYSRYNIENFGFVDSTDLKDFIAKDIPEDELKANYTYLDGNKYAKYEAKQKILYPIKTGTFTIPSYNFQVNVSTGDFFSSSKPVYIQTDSKKLTVKPLPQENQPANFSGIVGKLNLEAKYNKDEVEYGDSVTLQVKLSGNCNLDNLEEIIQKDIPGFTVYETQKNIEERIDNNQYTAQKEYEVIFVPEENGELTIAPIYIPYFDPQSGRYRQVEIPGTKITVTGEESQSQVGGIHDPSSIETIKIEQVNYNAPSNDEYVTIVLNKSYLILGFFVFLIIVGSVVLGVWLLLYRKGQDKNLEGFYKQIKNANDENAIYNGFNEMIKYYFHISLKASSRNEIIDRLGEQEITNSVLEIMDYMENGKSHTDNKEMVLKDKVKEIYRSLRKRNKNKFNNKKK